MARSELTWRVISALVAAPLAVAAIYFGDAPLAAALSGVAGLACWEFFRIARAAGSEPFVEGGVVVAAALPLIAHARRLGLLAPSLAWAAVAVLATLALTVWRRGPTRKPIAAAAVTVFGVAYTGGMLAFGYALRYHEYTLGAVDRAAGAAVLLLPVLLTWITDTGAYFVGRAVGRRKLAPSVSPGKTVEGAIGGLLLAVLVCTLYVQAVLAPTSQVALAPWAAILFGAVVSAAVQCGDLAESLMKREAGVKDSSRIVPGHGGVLDRVDGLIFALPTAYWLLAVLPLRAVPR